MDNTVALLGSINGSLKGVLDIMKANSSDNPNSRNAKTVSDLHGTGLKSSTVPTKDKKDKTETTKTETKEEATKKLLKDASIADIVKLLGDLPKAVQEIAKIKPKDVEAVGKVVTKLIETLDKIDSKYGNGSAKSRKATTELLKALGGIGTVVKDMAKVAPIAPFALIGVKLVTPVLKALIKVIDSIGNMKNISNASRNLRQMTRATKDIMLVAFGMMAMIAGLALVGMLVKVAYPQIMFGLAGVIVVMAGLTLVTLLVSQIARHITMNIKDFSIVMYVSAFSIAMILGCALVGLLVRQAWDIILYGFAGVTAVLLGITLVTYIVSLVAVRFKKFEFDVMQIGGMFILSALILGMSTLLGALAMQHWKEMGIGFVIVSAVVLAVAGIAWLVGKIAKSPDIRTATMNILLIEGAMLGAMGLVLALIGTSMLVKKFFKDNDDALLQIAGTFAMVSAIMLACLGLAKLASKIQNPVKQGAKGILMVEGLMVGAMVLAVALIGLHNLKKNAGVDWGDIYIDLLGVSGILGIATVIAAIVGIPQVQALVRSGTIALLLVEAMIAGAILVTMGLIGLHALKESSGTDWGMIYKDMLGVAGILGGFALVAAAAALLSIPCALGLVAMAVIYPFTKMVLNIAERTADITKKIQELGGIEALVKTVRDDVPKLLKGFTESGFSLGFKDLAKIGKMCIMYDAVSVLANKMVNVTEAVAKLAQIGGMVTEDGKLRPVLKTDPDGTVTYGEPVDIKLVAKTISGAVQEFVANCNYGFKDVIKMMFAAKVFEIIGTIVDPIDKFTKMITGYVSGGEGILTPVYIDKDGNLKESTVKCNVRDVAVTIVGAINAFLDEIYSEENITKWIEYTQGKRNGSYMESVRMFFGGKNDKTKAVEQVTNILAAIVSPVSQFIDLLCGLGVSNNGKLQKVELGEDGKLKYGVEVDPKKVAQLMVSGIGQFVTELYSGENVEAWMSAAADFDANKLLNPLNQYITTITTFCDPKKINADTIDKNRKAVVSLLDTLAKQMHTAKNDDYDRFATSVTKVSNSLQKFDNILQKDAKNRKSKLDEMKASFKSVAEQITKASNSLSAFSSSMKNMASVDRAKLTANFDAMSAGLDKVAASSQRIKEVDLGETNLFYASMKKALIDVFEQSAIKADNVTNKSGKYSGKFVIDVNN